MGKTANWELQEGLLVVVSKLGQERAEPRYEHSPFKATVFFLTDVIASSGMTVLPALRMGVTSTSSHWMGT
jgi:hypothetical protein